MEVVERHPTRRDLLEKARASLYDQDYQVAKATIMGAVNDFSLAVDDRTQRELRSALQLELWVRALLVALGLGLLAVLLLAHRALLQVLGAPVDTLHQHITRLGQGHFESDIAVGGSDPGSVLAHLAQTQAQLRTMQEQGRASNAAREEALKEAQTLMQALDEHAIVSITDAAGTITYANEMFSRISGFRNEELVGQNHRIVKFSASGAFLTQWGSFGTGNGQFSYPHGVALDSSDNVYVADWNNHRIQKFTSSGTSLCVTNSFP